MANLNGLELLGRQIKVNHVTDSSYTSMDILDGEDTDVGVGMTPQSRVALMAKLAEGHNAGASSTKCLCMFCLCVFCLFACD